MSLTQEDLQNLRVVVKEAVSEEFGERLGKNLKKVQDLFDHNFDERLGKNLEKVQDLFDYNFDNRLEIIFTKVEKMIQEAHAEQMELIFKHFPSSQDFQDLCERLDRMNNRTVNLEKKVAYHSYQLDVDPMPSLVQDVSRLKSKFKIED